MTMNKHCRHMFVCLSLLLLFAAAPTFAAEANKLAPEELADGWISLFDGETLFGWRPNGTAEWKVADGAIVAQADSLSMLTTTSRWVDFVLKLDFRAEKNTKSDIFLRSEPIIWSFFRGLYTAYAVALSGWDDNPTGSLIDRKTATGGEKDAAADKWQTLEITADGAKIRVKLDGREVLDYSDPDPIGRGCISLRLESGRVEFRNIKLKPLGMKSMFNGRDLSGWKTYPELKSVCSVTEKGELRIQNGQGQLESEGLYGDFTMQLDVFINGRGINSGIFFRSIPGEVMNGYESQIHNGFVDGDRAKPADCGTGGIFRRQDARRVVAGEFEWFTKTIHADGPHMAVWVNGYQVSDWTDTRKPDKNPRRGLRLEPGTIIIQGHDPTTDFLFRNLRIAEIAER